MADQDFNIDTAKRNLNGEMHSDYLNGLKPPKAVDSLVVTSTTTSSIAFAFTYTGKGQSGFQVLNEGGSEIQDLGPGERVFLRSGLSAGTEYTTRIKAYGDVS